MHTRTNQRGFAAVELAAIVLALVILGMVGWLTYRADRNSTPKANSSTAKSDRIKADSSSDESTVYTSITPISAVSDSTENTGYIEYSASTVPLEQPAENWLPITEWGIKIPALAAADDTLRLPLNYEPDISAPDNSLASVRIFQGPSSACSNGNRVPYVFIYRDRTWADWNGESKAVDYAFTISGHTYNVYKNLSSQGCTGDGSLVAQNEDVLVKQLHQAIAD